MCVNTVNKSSQNTLDVYCRVSTDIQVEKGHSLLAQENAGKLKAKSLGLNYRIHVEKGKSGASDDLEFKNRPVLKALLDFCTEGKVSDIFVTEQDRLSRSPVATFFIKQILLKNNINLHTINQTINLQDPQQSFVADLTALIARQEREMFVVRSKRAVIEGAKMGRWPGVILPYGFRRNSDRFIEIDPEEAEVYRKIVELSLSGHGTNTIALKLNKLDIETRCKKVLLNGTKVKNKHTGSIRVVNNEDFVWRAGTVYCMLTNPLYYGHRIFSKEIIPVPAIIDKETWDKIQANLKHNKNNSGNHATHFYLFKGKIRCAKCGANWYGKIKIDERVYMCSSKRQVPCGARSVNLDSFNDKIWNLIVSNKIQQTTIKDELKTINAPEKLKELAKKKSSIANQIAATEGRNENLITLYVNDKITMEQFEKRSAILKEEGIQLVSLQKQTTDEINEFSKKVDLLEESLADSKILKTISSWTDEEKKAFVDRKVRDIIVHWIPSEWQHIIEIKVELAGFVVTQYCAMVASNKPLTITQRELSVFEMQRLINATPLQIPHHGLSIPKIKAKVGS